MKYAEFTEDEKKFLKKRNLENLIETYREELLRVVDGEHCPDIMPHGARKRLRTDGILEVFGHRYEVTPQGREMLRKMPRCSNCGSSKDYIERTETGFRCKLCGREWRRDKLP